MPNAPSPKIQLLAFRGCPLVDSARRSVQQALAELRLESYEEIDLLDPATPAELRGWGSPTILVAGEDVAGGSKGDSVTCRVYPAPSRVPTPDEIAAAVNRKTR